MAVLPARVDVEERLVAAVDQAGDAGAILVELEAVERCAVEEGPQSLVARHGERAQREERGGAERGGHAPARRRQARRGEQARQQQDAGENAQRGGGAEPLEQHEPGDRAAGDVAADVGEEQRAGAPTQRVASAAPPPPAGTGTRRP